MPNFIRSIALCATVLALSACTKKSEPLETQDAGEQATGSPDAGAQDAGALGALKGTVTFDLTARGVSSTDDTQSTPAICATFSLTPYQLNADGSETIAGAAQVITSGNGASSSPILGCVHTPGLSPDWRYVVVANNFVGCDTPVSDISPASEPFTVDITCVPGEDVSATVTANVYIPQANNGGYVDVQLGVDATLVQAGCKQADIDSEGMLHFGQSYIQDTGETPPSAYTGIGIFTPPATSGTGAPDGTVQQFGGSVFEGNETDAYFTGLLQLPPSPQSATVVQAFTQPCPSGEMTIQPTAVECITNASLPGTTNTQTQIADLFVQWPGHGSVSATIAGAQIINLDTSLGGPNLSTLTPLVTGNDALAYTQALSLAPNNVTGIYGSLVHSEELLALVSTAIGPSLVVLSLNDTSGQWSAAAPIALSTLTVAQQQASGLFGAGGCFPEPIAACTQVLTRTESSRTGRPPAQARVHADDSSDAPSGTATLTLTHPNGVPVDSTNPVRLSYQTPTVDGMNASLQFSVSGLSAGQYAYAAITLCDPYGGILNTNAGTNIQIGAACKNGYQETQPTNSIAFAPILASGAGGVSENLQFFLAPANYFIDQSVTTWSVPVTLFVGSSATPQPSDTAVYTTTIAAPVTETHAVTTVNSILAAAEVPGSQVTLQDGSHPSGSGVLYTINYRPGLSAISGQDSDYLEGVSTLVLSPPVFTDPGVTVSLVQNSATVLDDGSSANANWPAAYTALGIDSDLTVDVATATATINNLIAAGGGNTWGPDLSAQWFTTIPTQASTILSLAGSITWEGNTYDTASFSLDVSPVPVANLDPFIEHSCLDDANAVVGPDTACQWMYNWNGQWTFRATRGTPGDNGGGATTLFNPDYVVKISPNVQISSSYLNSGVIPEVTISTSNDPGCDNTTVGDSTWTVQTAPQGPADWSSVQCISYQYNAVVDSPIIGSGFLTELKPAIVSGAPVLQITHDTMSFWVTAGNVLPTPGDLTQNTWAAWTQTATWKNTTELEIFDNGTDSVPVDTIISQYGIPFGHSWGIPIPDLTITNVLASGAAYDTATTPESWFNTLPNDVNGVRTQAACDPISGTSVTCHITSVSGAMIFSPGGDRVNGWSFQPRYQYLANQSFNGEHAVRSATVSTSAAWIQNASGDDAKISISSYDVVTGPNQLFIDKVVHAAQKSAQAGDAVPFDISYGAGGLGSAFLGAGGVAIYDFFGQDYQAGTTSTNGTLIAQTPGCVAPVPSSVSFSGATGGTSTPQAPVYYYTIDNPPSVTGTWTQMPAGPIQTGATGIKIIPTSSLGDSGVLLPIDGTQTTQVIMSSPTGSTGTLCNSAVLTANAFIPTATAEASVTITPTCDSSPWGVR